MQTLIQRAFAPVKRHTPRWFWSPLRRIMTGLIAPVRFSIRSGHFRSSLKDHAVDRHGDPLPWYSYPAIDFLAARDFSRCAVLEFGGGQSTLWWAARAKSVLALDEQPEWIARITPKLPANATMRLALSHAEAEPDGLFDVIVIDGLDSLNPCRSGLVPIALRHLAPHGILICDDGDGYGFHEALACSGMLRADFIGMAPAGVLQHCTSIYFRATSFAFLPLDTPRLVP